MSNSTSIAVAGPSRAIKTVAPLEPAPQSNLGQVLRTSSNSGQVQINPNPATSLNSLAAPDPKLPVPPPIFCTGTFADSKEGRIVDQASLNEEWSLIMDQLQSRPVSELLIVKTLESGILQKSTGKKLAPFFVEAMMRSIKPVEELKHEELHHFVEIIINQPSDVWADCFGEEITFGKGRINQFIQSKLDPCRTLQKQQIARGELLNDSTWNALRDFVQEARGIVDKDSDTKLNICLRNLEDFSEHRPSPEDAG